MPASLEGALDIQPRIEGFNNKVNTITITPQERELGLRTMRIFTTQIVRQLPWLIKDGSIVVQKPYLQPTNVETVPGEKPLPELTSRVIITDGLEKEQISPELATVLLMFKRVEDKLPYFMGRGEDIFLRIQGINRSYAQWGHEEGQHSDALGMILERTGHKTQDELDDDYYNNLTNTWTQPFQTDDRLQTARRMTIYAHLQEVLTARPYSALATRARDEGALRVAAVMTLISQDEAYHGSGYKKFARAFAEQDLEGTAADVIYVAENFAMPAQNLMLDPVKETLAAHRVGAFNREMVAQSIYSVLKGYEFIPEPVARATAARYSKKRVA